MDRFDRPIPGESLTSAPRDFPWERPPELVEVGDVVDYYIQKLANDETMDDMAATFEMGADVNTIVGSMMKMGAMNGLHTVQAGMLAGPSVGAFIKAAMSTYGIDAKEEAVDSGVRQKKRAEKRVLDMVRSKMDIPSEEEVMEEAPAAEPEQAEVVMQAEESPMGLMARE